MFSREQSPIEILAAGVTALCNRLHGAQATSDAGIERVISEVRGPDNPANRAAY